MNNKSQDSVISHETTITNSSKITSGTKRKCYELFFSCFKVNRKKKAEKNFVDYEPKKYDYIVEKLIVKRVPYVFFAIPEDTLDAKNYDRNEDTQKLLVTTETNTIYPTASETGSLSYYSDRLNQNMSTGISNNLYFDENITALNKNYKRSILSTNYNVNITKLMNTMSTLHTGLKEFKRLSQDSCPLNISKNNNISSKEVEEITSVKGIVNKNYGNQKHETFALFPLTYVQESSLAKKGLKDLRSPEIKSGSEQNMYNLKQIQGVYPDKSKDSTSQNNGTRIVQPVQNILCNFTNFKKTFINANQLNARDCDQEHIKSQINDKLQSNRQMSANESKLLAESITNIDPSSITLRWKIIVKHYKHKTLHNSKSFQETKKYFSTS